MFNYIKIRLTFRALEDMTFPIYAGSTLRGIFGKALRRSTCLAKQTECANCAIYQTCPYASLFENGYTGAKGEEIPNPYVIEPFPMGTKKILRNDTFSFEHILFGSAVEKLPYVLLAWYKSGNYGFTTERTQARLITAEQILTDGTPFLLCDFENTEEEQNSPLLQETPPLQKEISKICITLKTPLRLQHNGHPLTPDSFSAYNFLVALIRRLQNMEKYHACQTDLPDFDILRPLINGATITQKDLHWFDWKRYSSRQKTTIALGGVMGTFVLEGDLTTLYPYLKYGELLHVGKSAVLGLGKYVITSI
jgi:hypothetical protein